jgi:hypothetical protein
MPLEISTPDAPQTPDASTPTEKKPADTGNIPLPVEGLNTLELWKQRISGSTKVVDDLQSEWNHNQKLYEMESTGALTRQHVIVPDAYTYTEQKKAIFLAAVSERVMVEGKQEGLEQAATVFEAVLNHYLGDSENSCANFPAAVDEVLSDLLCPAGIAAVKIGFQPTVDGTKKVPTGQTQPDPMWQPSPEDIALSLQTGVMPQAPQVPVMADVPNIISFRYEFDRISPSNLLLPEEFKLSTYDRANWIGYRFEMDLELGKRLFSLPADFEGSGNTTPRGINVNDEKRTNRKVITGTELYYKASVYDPSVKNPELQRCLVIVDGIDEPVKHIDSKYQKKQADGRLTGMQGFPVHVYSLRYESDKQRVKSDVSNLKTQVEVKSRYRTAQILTQERSVPQRLASKAVMGESMAALEKGSLQAIIPVDNLLQDGDPGVKSIDLAHTPQENQVLASDLERDMQMTMGMSPNQTGAINTGNRSAQEVATAAQGSGTRQDKEIAKFKRDTEKAISKLASVIQMYALEESVIRITGPGGQKKFVSWDRNTIAGEFAFTIKIDVVKERQEYLNFYNLFAPSPNANRLELDKELVEKYGHSPEKLIVQPQQPPPPKPDMPKLTVSIGEKELSPLNPSFGIYIELLRASGVNISDEAVLLAQKAALNPASAIPGGSVAGVTAGQPGGVEPMGAADVQPQPQLPEGQGSAEQAPKLNQHMTERTGDLTGPKPTLDGR